jgi:protein O-GlcNAc transferase
LAGKIRADGIDILIDLSGHTAKNRLLTFARKPAPVQISWMGYPGTSGLQAMDYYFSDRFLTPPGLMDDQFTEKLVYLPVSSPFQMSKQMAPVNDLPALRNGYITFGSFNRPNKISHEVVAMWSRVLLALPDTHLLLGGMPQTESVNLIDWFEKEGVMRSRLHFYPKTDMAAYLTLHHRVDICLDTFPYNGGTTTLHALSMGVPTLSLAGQKPVTRGGASILGRAGLEDFVVYNKDDFVNRAVYWANHVPDLAQLRGTLRERLSQSCTCHPAAVAATIRQACHIVWQRWCAGWPTQSFELTLQDVGLDAMKFTSGLREKA